MVEVHGVAGRKLSVNGNHPSWSARDRIMHGIFSGIPSINSSSFANGTNCVPTQTNEISRSSAIFRSLLPTTVQMPGLIPSYFSSVKIVYQRLWPACHPTIFQRQDSYGEIRYIVGR